MKKLFATLVALLLAIATLFPQPAFAQVFFPSPKGFTITQACDATRSIKKGGDPLTLHTEATYKALGTNKARGASHVYISVNGDRKWVAIECGTFEDGTSFSAPPPKPEPSQPQKSQSTAFSPFFDTEDNPVCLPKSGCVDATPEPPELDEFDLAVNEVCGEPGKVVSRQEFKDLMNAHPAVLAEIRDYTDGEVYGDRSAPKTTAAYLDALTDAWFSAEGFDHIFCGEPVPGGKIGGLHYHGRYLDLQQKGLAGRLDNNERREEIAEGTIYTIGAAIKVNGQLAISSIKGYGYTLSAKDLLKFATRAFADNPTTSTRSTACLLPIEDDGKAFTMIFVRRSQGIRTFYPDATPSNRDPVCVQ
ncbi:MAG: EndoU domain-containing protein [Cyanobacteria bacterium SBLK]|nr:EndoU domain-containing protein [Cyanobacteria bacterium SBLK]